MEKGFTWINEDRKKIIQLRNEIVKNRDIERLFDLEDDSDFSIALREILENDCEEPYNPKNLNKVSMTLFLCMALENASQADSILCFLEDDYREYKNIISDMLYEIGAVNCSQLVMKAIEILPKNESSFYKTASEKEQNLMKALDSEFSNYPDGKMTRLYRAYANLHKEDLYK